MQIAIRMQIVKRPQLGGEIARAVSCSVFEDVAGSQPGFPAFVPIFKGRPPRVLSPQPQVGRSSASAFPQHGLDLGLPIVGIGRVALGDISAIGPEVIDGDAVTRHGPPAAARAAVCSSIGMTS